MTSQADAKTAPTWPWAVLALGLFVAGSAMAFLRRTDVDVAWLLTMGEKMLAGQRPYVDVFEANPPMSILLYLPAVIAGRGLGVAADAMVIVLVLAAIVASLAFCGRILAPVLDRSTRWKLAAAAVFVLAVLPMGVFSQREHIAIVFMLPFLALVAARGEGARPAPWSAVLAGLGCGLAMAIKPHFALAAGGALAVAMMRRRSPWPALQAEIWAASAVVIAYAAVVFTVFPAFMTFLPVIRDAYLPIRQPMIALLTWPPLAIWLIFAAIAGFVVRCRCGAAWTTWSLLAASAGGFASYLIQGKGWPYHSYPMLALAVLALATAAVLGAPKPAAGVLRHAAARIVTASVCLVLTLGAVVVSLGWFGLKGDMGALNAPVQALAPHPKLLSISADIAVGEPLTRELHGQWVGSVCSQWISAGAMTLEHRGGLSDAQRLHLRALMAIDRRLLVHDILTGRPDVILISTSRDWLGWARADPALAAALAAYHPVRTVEGVAIWARTGAEASARHGA